MGFLAAIGCGDDWRDVLADGERFYSGWSAE
jgi:hypothetical protein